MGKTIDFNGLLNDLFQEDVPIREKSHEHPQSKKNGADFSMALDAIFQGKENCDVGNFTTSTGNSACCGDMGDMNEADIFPLQACNLYVFMRKIVMERFGAGNDYAISDRNGIPLKSWFTIPEAIEAAKSQGYRLTVAEAKSYLDALIKQRYIETDNYKYRRCAIWDREMDKYLLHSLL